MTDKEFNFIAVPQRYPDVVQRLAVLNPLRGPASTPNIIVQKTIELQEQWRARISSLCDADWQPREPVARFRRSVAAMRNCRPTFAISEEIGARRCCVPSVCPFCYARNVRDIWEQIDTQFVVNRELVKVYDDDPKRIIQRDGGWDIPISGTGEGDEPEVITTFPYHLLERQHTFRRQSFADVDAEAAKGALLELLNGVTKVRADFVDMVDPVGALVCTAIVPSADCAYWQVTQRQLFKVKAEHPGFSSEIQEMTRGSIRRYDRPTRSIVMRAVARTLVYPAGLLTGNASMVAFLLNMRKDIRFRSHVCYRSFRSKTVYD